MILRFAIIILILLAIDLYGWYGLKKLLQHGPFSSRRRQILRAYWFMDVGFIIFSIIWVIIIRTSSWPDYVMYRNYFYITGAFVLIFLPKLVFLIFNSIDDGKRLIFALIRYLSALSDKTPRVRLNTYPVILTTGFVLSLFMFVWVLYGVGYGRFHFQVKEVTVELESLPESFEGMRIIHITDTHFGSFARKRPVERALKKIRSIPHDMLLFTGDMVNNEAVEAERFIESFQKIQPPHGMYSVLGNHDMGDYRRWYTIEEKEANLEQLEEIQHAMGFTLLRNQHEFIVRKNDSLMIAGVDNWGLPPFAQYGDLDEALGEANDFPHIILLSHDPSHWREQVIPQTRIMLTLSGHTHGMQSGINTPWFQWSPVALKYDEWSGLYNESEQFLYVNRGLGYLGFPGRLGMRPEITVITLRSS